ncbi:TDP-N-acetylfucosamine:lipid II N-acetylfucosaminyltransferase [Glaesserella sp.]|uniref:TDP-N-acetylfucosamine:lipid II N-acetylfucosaminyltransferase n=1 Tax=Glaesserella sp. TaxID=2094731 RepID=UPI00359F7065
MQKIFHILGANIPHHNRQVLAFFQQELLSCLPHQEHHFLVVGDETLENEFSKLSLQRFSSKNAIVSTATALAKKESNAYFIFHGQFNIGLWFAILFNRLPTKYCVWHIWGADLYRDSNRLLFKLFYPIRRLAQQKIARIWATRGDLHYAHQHLVRETAEDRILYFPTKMADISTKSAVQPIGKSTPFTILLGNSGDVSNRHIQALTQIKRQLGNHVHIIIPMGYPANNQPYIDKVKAHAHSLFSVERIELWEENIDFEQYSLLLKRCDLGYFMFRRQQGIGTICLLTQLNIPVVLHRDNPFSLDMQAENIPFLWQDELRPENIAHVQRAIQHIDKHTIAFFPPNYRTQWLAALSQLSKTNSN